MRVGLVVPHIFMHKDILPGVIFSPGPLARDLCEGLQTLGAEVTLFSPGPADVDVPTITADMTRFEAELAGRGYGYIDLLKKHPLTFVSLARQVQAEIIAQAFAMANRDELDVVHIYTNEEDIALPFAALCRKPVVFTHHDPFSFLIKYKHVFPKYRHLNWISISDAQRADMPADTNWLATIHHGIHADAFEPTYQPAGNYIAYLGRIIEPKGTHLAIAAVRQYNQKHPKKPLSLRIAGKHYAGHSKDTYWQNRILPELDDVITYEGFVRGKDRQSFLANASALIVPSTFEEPFGMVLIEALASGTPIIGLDSGAIPEIIKNGQNGILVHKAKTDEQTVNGLAQAIEHIDTIDRRACRQDFEARFTTDRMCQNHLDAYARLIK